MSLLNTKQIMEILPHIMPEIGRNIGFMLQDLRRAGDFDHGGGQFSCPVRKRQKVNAGVSRALHLFKVGARCGAIHLRVAVLIDGAAVIRYA